jgi:hypothetical protein
MRGIGYTAHLASEGSQGSLFGLGGLSRVTLVPESGLGLRCCTLMKEDSQGCAGSAQMKRGSRQIVAKANA